MHRLMFVVPAHGRVSLTRVCLRQLRRTCDAMRDINIEASAIVVSDDENADTARGMGFGVVRRDNEFLSRRFNDGIQLACDPRFNPRPAEFVVPCGSDDWVDYRIFETLPGPDSIVCFRRAAFVDETGTALAVRTVDYEGGVGIRVYPRAMLARLGYRPADEDRKRACDTSILVNVKRTYRDRPGPFVLYGAQSDYAIVDWKSRGEQLNAFSEIANRFHGPRPSDPFETLADHYPRTSLDDMRAVYGR